MTRHREKIRLMLASSVALSMAPVVFAESAIASRFSPEWRALKDEVNALDAALTGLPDIPIEDFGGTRPFLRVFNQPTAMEDRRIDFTIRLDWPEARPVDLVALVPARKIDSGGLDPNYGFPEDFRISLIHGDGSSHPLAEFTSTSSNPAHRGHPILVRADGNSAARGLEIHITRARMPRPGAPALVFVALAEIFCYSGNHNLAADATVSIPHHDSRELPSFWSPELLIDGVTPLGLPEQPAPNEGERNIGWLSKGRAGAEEGISIRLDLGKSHRINGMRLFPALRPSIGDFPGFGIPQEFRLKGGDGISSSILFDHTSEPTPSIGHNPHEFRFPTADVRHIELEAVKLWKPYPYYPAFLAFSEIELLDGDTVVSSDAEVIVPEETSPIPAQGELMWSPASLTDGWGPNGVLMPRHQWLGELDKRLALETRRHEVLQRMDQLGKAWDGGTLATAITLGLAAIGFAAVLPSRYRLRERRRIRHVRESIASDLHDDVGTNLGSIQMLTALARSKKEPKEELETIHQVAAETVTSVRDIVWLLHPDMGNRVATIDHLRESAAILLEPLEWNLTSDFKDWTLGDQDGRHLVLFFREALHNLRRHADASKVSIRVQDDQGTFVLTISDNGRGIDLETLEHPASLRALRQRAEKLDGNVEIRTLPGEGTTITLRFVPRGPGSATAPAAYPPTPSDPS